ncbi:MAG: hypothetical protein WBD63_02490 [Phycisphaerae bacterium]|nr:hypothetical protein [Phycisphaerae bacterium]
MWDFPELDEEIRKLMLDEVSLDEKSNDGIYPGKYLNEKGRKEYPALLREALTSGNPDTFTQVLSPCPGPFWIPRYVRRNGVEAAVPKDSPSRLAEGEFNRYYMRAISIRAISQKQTQVQVYRAKQVKAPRWLDVKVKEGDLRDPQVVLQDLRSSKGTATQSGIPRGPNSGLSLRTVPDANAS